MAEYDPWTELCLPVDDPSTDRVMHTLGAIQHTVTGILTSAQTADERLSAIANMLADMAQRVVNLEATVASLRSTGADVGTVVALNAPASQQRVAPPQANGVRHPDEEHAPPHRRRISCDQCRFSHMGNCNKQTPCVRCDSLNLTCTYRSRKLVPAYAKRKRASSKNPAKQASKPRQHKRPRSLDHTAPASASVAATPEQERAVDGKSEA